jgi:hypothetical protein
MELRLVAASSNPLPVQQARLIYQHLCHPFSRGSFPQLCSKVFNQQQRLFQLPLGVRCPVEVAERVDFPRIRKLLPVLRPLLVRAALYRVTIRHYYTFIGIAT